MMTPRGLLSRLRGVDLVLLAPSRAVVGANAHRVRVDPAVHRTFLTGVRLLRDRADGQFATPQLPADNLLDLQSWHVVGLEAASGEIVGAIRAKVYHPTAGGPSVSDLFAFSDVEIGDVRIREAVSRGLAAYMAEQEVRCGRFYQVGGFAVAARFRGSALAPVLALAANAWRDHLGLYGGCTFATLTNGVADLD
jgi:hypothetical protein